MDMYPRVSLKYPKLRISLHELVKVSIGKVFESICEESVFDRYSIWIHPLCTGLLASWSMELELSN